MMWDIAAGIIIAAVPLIMLFGGVKLFANYGSRTDGIISLVLMLSAVGIMVWIVFFR